MTMIYKQPGYLFHLRYINTLKQLHSEQLANAYGKKAAGNPLGPGALVGHICERASAISSTVKRFSSWAFIFGDTFAGISFKTALIWFGVGLVVVKNS